MVVIYGFPVTYTVSVHLMVSYFAELWTVWAWHVSSINEKFAVEDSGVQPLRSTPYAWGELTVTVIIAV